MNREKAKEAYIKRMNYFREHPGKRQLLHVFNKIATVTVFVSYAALLLWLLLQKSASLARAIIVPMDGFIILSVFRWLINRRRPYEVYETAPVIEKSTKGKSFPSRHVFSVFAIAMTFFFASPWPAAGVLLLLLGVIIAGLRVISGVHFISDVLAGAAWGVLCSLIGYLWIFT